MKKYKVLLGGDRWIEVEGDHYDIGATIATLALPAPLLITKEGEAVAVFPHGEWQALLILELDAVPVGA